MGEDRTPPVRRTTVAEAAEALGISAEAVRGRIRRGTLPVERIGGTVYVLLDPGLENRTTTDQPRTTDRSYDRTNAVVSMLREQIAYLQGVIATRDQELATRAEEIRRRDTALEREQELAAMFAERLRALEAPAEVHEPTDTPPAAYETASNTPVGITLNLLLAAGTGIAAGVANPLLIVEAIQRNLDTRNILWLVWLALFLLWALPPIFGFWLGRTMAILKGSMHGQIEDLSTQTEGSRVIELHLGLPFYAGVVGLAAVFSSRVAPYVFGIQINPDAAVTLGLWRAWLIAIVQGIVSTMFVLFTGLIGFGWVQQRHAAARARAGGRDATEPSAGSHQALIGLVGTIVTAIAGLVGILAQIFYGSGGPGS